MQQRVLYARLGHKPPDPLRLRSPKHEVANRQQRAKENMPAVISKNATKL